MIKKIFLPTILLILIYWFWISPEFKIISAWVAIFLFWMVFLEQWFKVFTWGTLEKILHNSTNKTWKSLMFGFTSAAVMQSSSLVSLLTISFLSAELITLIQWIWIIFWANVWTTTWAWLIAWFWMKINISLYAMPMLVFWIILSFQKAKALKWFWSILAWLGFLFLWIHYMKEGFDAFQNSFQLIDYALEWLIWIFVFVWLWIVATVIMQSSHATIILIIAALATGQVTYENALALVIGANIGTTITAILWSLTSNVDGKRLALVAVLFNVITWIIFIMFLPFISEFVNYLWNIIWISSDNYTLKLALFHTLFSVVWLVVIIPFINNIANLVVKLFPDNSNQNINKPIYLNNSVLDFPDTALISLVKETKNLYIKSTELILEWLWLTVDDILTIDKKEELTKKIKILEVEDIEKLYKTKIKNLYSEILDFISNAQADNYKKYYNNFYKLKSVNIKIIENIKYLQYLQKNFLKYTKSTNSNIKEEYQKLIFETVELIKIIYKLSEVDEEHEKLMLLSEIELNINKNDTENNKNIDNLIRNNLITNQMASSLINDSYYKNQISKNLLEISQIIFNNKISEDVSQKESLKDKKLENLFSNTFWLSNKKLDKSLKKLLNKKNNLEQKLKKVKSMIDKKEIAYQIEIINYTLEKYR